MMGVIAVVSNGITVGPGVGVFLVGVTPLVGWSLGGGSDD